MSRQSNRRQAKRRQKQTEIRRRQSHPFQRIGSAGEPLACYINRDWDENGLASMIVLRRVPGGGHAMGAFLVDRWCVGLKDAWGVLDIDMLEFNEKLAHMGRHMEIVRVDVDVVRRLVAGGMRFAQQNGFRLPPRCERWFSFLGGGDDWHSADVSEFGVSGKLRYVGTVDDLRRRLVGQTAEAFLERPDVEFIVGPRVQPGSLEAGGDSGFEGDEDDDDEASDEGEIEIEELIGRLVERSLDHIRQWCFANQEVPHPGLRSIFESMAEAMLQIQAPVDLDAELDTAAVDEGMENLHRLTSQLTSAEQAQFVAAQAQFDRYMRQFNSPDEWAESLRLDELCEIDDPAAESRH